MIENDTATIQCPYCWEYIHVMIDCSHSHQEYIEDCSVCCHPISICIECDDDNLTSISALSGNA